MSYKRKVEDVTDRAAMEIMNTVESIGRLIDLTTDDIGKTRADMIRRDCDAIKDAAYSIHIITMHLSEEDIESIRKS